MTQAAASRPSLLRYWSPRYWPTWLLLLWFVLAAQLPFRVNMRLHRLLGRLAGALIGRRARVARCNLEICFPERSPAEIESLLRRHFEAMGACVGETAFAWFASVPRLHRLLEIEGAEHLEAALERGRGALLFTGHFTGLEITGPLLSAVTDRFTFMFSRRRNGLLDELQRRRRERVAARSFEKEQVRALLRSLKDNCVVWYAADQYYRGSHAGLVRFFHEPAMTNTAVSRIAALSGAPVVPFFYRRREDDSGYILSFEAPVEGLPSGDAAADTRRLVQRLEAAVRRCPEQYWWSHKRFRNRPAPLPDLYAVRHEGGESGAGEAAGAIGQAAGATGPVAGATGQAAGATGPVAGAGRTAGVAGRMSDAPTSAARAIEPLARGVRGARRLAAQIVRGICIGAAHLVPGLSGTSVAAIVGTGGRYSAGTSLLDRNAQHESGGRRFRGMLRGFNLSVGLPVVAGVIAAPIIFSRTVPLGALLEELPEMTFGLVFGLIAASMVSLLVSVDERRLPLYGWLVLGVALGCGAALFAPSAAPDSLWFLFLCGLATVAAMLLPGVSGAFVLLVLGQYAAVIEALRAADVSVLLPLAAGAATGAVAFSRGMTWLLRHRRQPTMLVVVGFLGGSLLAVWPFREWVFDDGFVRLAEAHLYIPQALDRGVLLGVGTMLAGFLLHHGIERLARRAGQRKRGLAGSGQG